MRALLYSGLLYLAGVAVILILQPSLMFNDEGVWKEFGIGRNPQTHTWLPFWLFAVIWALLSYIIILLVIPTVLVDIPTAAAVNTAASAASAATASDTASNTITASNTTTASNTITADPNLSYKNFIKPKGAKKAASKPVPGYYILNRDATEEAGMPKYIYLGEEPPGLEND